MLNVSIKNIRMRQLSYNDTHTHTYIYIYICIWIWYLEVVNIYIYIYIWDRVLPIIVRCLFKFLIANQNWSVAWYMLRQRWTNRSSNYSLVYRGQILIKHQMWLVGEIKGINSGSACLKINLKNLYTIL